MAPLARTRDQWKDGNPCDECGLGFGSSFILSTLLPQGLDLEQLRHVVSLPALNILKRRLASLTSYLSAVGDPCDHQSANSDGSPDDAAP